MLNVFYIYVGVWIVKLSMLQYFHNNDRYGNVISIMLPCDLYNSAPASIILGGFKEADAIILYYVCIENHYDVKECSFVT